MNVVTGFSAKFFVWEVKVTAKWKLLALQNIWK